MATFRAQFHRKSKRIVEKQQHKIIVRKFAADKRRKRGFNHSFFIRVICVHPRLKIKIILCDYKLIIEG
jgi:hypothetical protein